MHWRLWGSTPLCQRLGCFYHLWNHSHPLSSSDFRGVSSYPTSSKDLIFQGLLWWAGPRANEKNRTLDVSLAKVTSKRWPLKQNLWFEWPGACHGMTWLTCFRISSSSDVKWIVTTSLAGPFPKSLNSLNWCSDVGDCDGAKRAWKNCASRDAATEAACITGEGVDASDANLGIRTILNIQGTHCMVPFIYSIYTYTCIYIHK